MQRVQLLVAQPAVTDPNLFNLGLGIQNDCTKALSRAGIAVVPSLYWCDDLGGRRRPLYAAAPYSPHHEAAEVRARENARITHCLQMQLRPDASGVRILAGMWRCRFGARFGMRSRRDCVWALERGSGERAILDAIDEVAQLCTAWLGPREEDTSDPLEHDWRMRLKTEDPAEAVARLLVRAGHVRERFGLLRTPVLDKVAVEWDSRRRSRAC